MEGKYWILILILVLFSLAILHGGGWVDKEIFKVNSSLQLANAEINMANARLIMIAQELKQLDIGLTY